MNLKRFGIGFMTLCSIFVLALSLVSAAERTLTYPLSVSAYDASASLDTTCTYVDSGSTRWKNYKYTNYSVNNSVSYGMKMKTASWVTGGSDSKGYHTNTFTWKMDAYLMSDKSQNALVTRTKKVQYKYTISDNGYRATLVE